MSQEYIFHSIPLTHVIDETDGTQCGILIINTFFVEGTKMTWDGQNFLRFFLLKSHVDSNTPEEFLHKMALEFFGFRIFFSFSGLEFFETGKN